MKGDKTNNFLLAALIVLASLSVYNINAVANGVNHQYIQGLVIVTIVSMALSALLILVASRPKKVS